jgi:acyl-CoA reductase-like NAD-dependent aldehyde dehydrogenase
MFIDGQWIAAISGATFAVTNPATGEERCGPVAPVVCCDDVDPTAASAPLGGMRDSGIGRDGSHDGINDDLETELEGMCL